jgi:basic amino acid/polyamine antiporter, APA family
MSAQSQPSYPGTFVRKASGLVRTAGPMDVLAYNINFISIGLLLTFMFLFMPSLYPGVNMYLSMLIAVIITVPTGLVYGFLAASMPRSGGDYVYNSRILGPALGTMANWNITIWWFFYGGVPSAFFARYGISPLLRVLGAYTGNLGLVSAADSVSSPTGTFLLGALLLIVLTVIFVLGLKRFFVVQNILFFLALLSTILVIGVWLFASPGAFHGAFNGTLGKVSGQTDLYSGIVTSAKSGGFGLSPFSFYYTLLPITWIYLNLGFSFSSAYIGGEVKNAKRLQLWAAPVAILVVAAVVMLTIFAADHAIGLGFFGSAGFITDWTKLGLSFTPTYSELAAYSAGNLFIAFLIMFGFLFWSYAWLPGQILNGSRNLVAYSIDGLLPRRFGEVHPKFHTPAFSLGVMCVASLISLAIYVYTPYFATLVGIFGFILTFGLTSIAAILIPYRAKTIFETSPVRWHIRGVPVISILGVLSLIMCGFMEWIFLSDPNAGLLSTTAPFFSQIPYGMAWLNVAIFLSGLLLYFIAKAVQSRRGMNVDLSYKEIPVE